MDDKALSAYYAAYTQEMLIRETELVMLAQRMLNAEVPYEAAAILEKGFGADIIEVNLKNLKLLAMSFTMAQEMDKAIDAWRNATKLPRMERFIIVWARHWPMRTAIRTRLRHIVMLWKTGR